MKKMKSSPDEIKTIIKDAAIGEDIFSKSASAGVYHGNKPKKAVLLSILLDMIITIVVIAAATGIGLAFRNLGVSMLNVITIYIFGVLVLSLLISNRWFCLISSIISVLVFNIFFTEPFFSLSAYDSSYPITFIVLFCTAFITSSLAAKIKQNSRQSKQKEYQTRVLFDAHKLLQKAETESEVTAAAANQLVKLLNRSVIFYGEKRGKLSEPKIFSAEGETVPEEYVLPDERQAAERAFGSEQGSGEAAESVHTSKCLYLAARVNDRAYGVFGIAVGKNKLDSFEKGVVLSIIGELALSLDNLRNIKEKNDAAVLAQNEQFRANLLRSISHDLRTPLTSISGNAGFLIAEGEGIEPEMRAIIYKSIYDDSLWLINLVENLLSATRIEDGTTKLRLRSELMEDVVDEAVSRVRNTSGRRISVNVGDELLILKMDARLIVQVIVNILDNAVKYSPADTEINVNVFRQGKNVAVEISDFGKGVSDKDKPRIFDMFYTAETKIADSRRSMGLGLAVCKSIITAHGGEISVRDNKPTGSVFCFTLPVEEVNIHE